VAKAPGDGRPRTNFAILKTRDRFSQPLNALRRSVLEGYGATECGPAISVNTPLAPKFGSAGKLMPGMDYRLEPVEGVPEESVVVVTRGWTDAAKIELVTSPATRTVMPPPIWALSGVGGGDGCGVGLNALTAACPVTLLMICEKLCS